jgi:hypothetical protein
VKLLQRLFGTGNVPYVLVLATAASAFVAGRLTTPEPPAVVTAEASALILRAALEHPELSAEQLSAAVRQPITEVIQRYARQGHLVVDIGVDESGRYGLLAVPERTVDITENLRAAIQLPVQRGIPSDAPAPATRPSSPTQPVSAAASESAASTRQAISEGTP